MLNVRPSEWFSQRRGARLGALGLVLALLAGACGDDDSSSPATTGTSAPGTEAAACHQVEHVLGEACVPASPQRIVTLDPYTALPTLLELGASVIGTTSPNPDARSLPHYLDAAQTVGLTIVGSAQEPDLEQIAALQPDLIVGWSTVIEPIQSQLEAIAPTVATHYSFYNPDWRDDVRSVAALVGGAAHVDAELDALDTRAAGIAQLLPPPPDALTISRVDTWQGNALFYRFDCVWFGDVLTSAGLVQPEQQTGDCTPDDPATSVVLVSPEQFHLFDADVIVAYLQPEGADDVAADPITALAAIPTWGALPAVQAGHVLVGDDAWGVGASIPAAEHILDDIGERVVPLAP